jgi:hypothetical protein
MHQPCACLNKLTRTLLHAPKHAFSAVQHKLVLHYLSCNGVAVNTCVILLCSVPANSSGGEDAALQRDKGATGLRDTLPAGALGVPACACVLHGREGTAVCLSCHTLSGSAQSLHVGSHRLTAQ